MANGDDAVKRETEHFNAQVQLTKERDDLQTFLDTHGGRDEDEQAQIGP